MTFSLPPLTAIRVFEAVARLGSFTRAGEELGMTQAAVSYQIKLLEERFGGALFLRHPRRIELTDAGRRLAPAVTEAFGILSDAYAAARSGVEGVLSITALFTFATAWLTRNIGSFQVANPGLAVRIDTSGHIVDFNREDFDIGIRTGRGDWPGVVKHRLISNRFAPMLSPKLAASIGGLKEPADFLRLPILDHTDEWWHIWFARAGLVFEPEAPVLGIGVQAFSAAAAIAGEGVALLNPELYRSDLREGRLIQPFDILADDGLKTYLVYPENRRNLPKVRAFRDWILERINQDSADCG